MTVNLGSFIMLMCGSVGRPGQTQLVTLANLRWLQKSWMFKGTNVVTCSSLDFHPLGRWRLCSPTVVLPFQSCCASTVSDGQNPSYHEPCGHDSWDSEAVSLAIMNTCCKAIMLQWFWPRSATMNSVESTIHLANGSAWSTADPNWCLLFNAHHSWGHNSAMDQELFPGESYG